MPKKSVEKGMKRKRVWSRLCASREWYRLGEVARPDKRENRLQESFLSRRAILRSEGPVLELDGGDQQDTGEKREDDKQRKKPFDPFGVGDPAYCQDSQ